MLIKNYSQFKQLDMDIFMFSLTIEEILENYKVDIYDEENGNNGYQRPPIPSHYKNIAKYLIENSDSVFLPSAILGAIDYENIYFQSSDELKFRTEIRIVDGQHRIKGFEYAINKLQENGDITKSNELLKVELPIILMAINHSHNDKLNEINAFIDINSKGKPVSTDLAITLRNTIYSQSTDYLNNAHERKERIATKTSKYLTEIESYSMWYHAIKRTPSDKGTIISLNSFNKSLYPIVDQIDKNLQETAGFSKAIQKEDVDNAIKELQLFILQAWETIYDKWHGCFGPNRTFEKGYNIQKGIGVHSLHLILSECVFAIFNRNIEDNLQEPLSKIFIDSLELFNKKIYKSSVTEEDWLAGKKFSGYNSASGFKKVKYYILHGEFPN
ncbi:DGQHR domain-containing protein [Bacillus cereus]|uniref:DGQHR domain-containing protein n=1 Tax=Bacillus cereus group TaxID=86661 RepID=UPI000BF8484B|nr:MULTISPECIES: DGQHR domain-containing protein [Bacillus cereus group]MDZ4530143.1 DGQHR domain-containing protein [Bacillus cereus]PEQ41025.1 hypothetical protein CN466_06910 [Bacillus cereus]PES12739.1 hypothetical protein CN501_16445 [Bacillus cereus]PEV68921.1 hypothetical protein CN423_02120 [Bacillus cereus]PFD80990.1 hypothetical protein CN313_14190 [Bacillus cereus]